MHAVLCDLRFERRDYPWIHTATTESHSLPALSLPVDFPSGFQLDATRFVRADMVSQPLGVGPMLLSTSTNQWRVRARRRLHFAKREMVADLCLPTEYSIAASPVTPAQKTLICAEDMRS